MGQGNHEESAANLVDDFSASSAIDQDYFSTWEQYSNARRISGDLECEGRYPTLTSWPLTSERWSDLLGWQNYANSQGRWNDLGPLEIGNTVSDGFECG